MEPLEQNSLGDLLAKALMSDHNIVVCRASVQDGRTQVVFAIQVLEVTVDGVTESLLIDDMPVPPKDQLN